jgi:hypothetical protein
MTDPRGILELALDDGRPPLNFVALSLLLSGAFAVFLAATGQFLPHDVAYLGISADELCALNKCRIVDFMIHDRTAFGGALVAVGLLYLWLIAVPLKQGQPWAWWTLALSGSAGFLSFFTYLGYGYLDTWHGAATLVLGPIYAAGLYKSRGLLQGSPGIAALRHPGAPFSLTTPGGIGRGLILLVTFGMMAAGSVILTIGISEIFVPQDLIFMEITLPELHALNARLVSLIAHDRAGFGGAILSTGLAAFLSVWCGSPTKNLWQILFLAGSTGFGGAILTHYVVGYTDIVHLAPAYLGASLFSLGLIFSFRSMMKKRELGR